MIVEEGWEDWKGDWVDANPDTVRMVRDLVDEDPPNAEAYEVANASPKGCAACVVPEKRLTGIAAQVYSLWSPESQGIGDLVDVATLAAESDADVLLLSPLHAPNVDLPQQPSPYFPGSRQFRNPLHLRVDGVRLPNDPDALIDRDEVWKAKRAALLEEWDGRDEPIGDPELRSYAEFCSRDGNPPAFHAWVQSRIEHQLRVAANAGAGLVHDIAVGFDPNGADASLWSDVIAPGMHIGAPPDEFNTAGQDWGLPPFIPDRLSATGFRPIVAALEAAAEFGAGMRIDHVMGLFRLYWIPDGADPGDGVYVRYPAAELLDAVAEVSQRHDVFVVGEDLGTVEPGVREALAARNVMSYKVFWFEDDAPPRWPALSLASVTTHDLPTIAGKGESVDDIHRQVLQAGSRVVLLTAEDLLGVTEQPNQPGTQVPTNWSRRLPRPVGDVATAYRAQIAGQRETAAQASRSTRR